MIEEKDEQTAVAEDANEAPKEEPAAESGAAQEDGLDELLKEFDERKAESVRQEQTQTKTEPTGTEQQVDVAALAALERRLNDQEARERQRELDGLYGRLADGLQADDLQVEGYLNALARRNPDLNAVWNNRTVKPRDWERAEAALKKECQKVFGKRVDKQVTESREAVTSAVRSASTAAPHKELTRQEIVNMSKDEWDETQRKMGITPV